MRKAKKYVLFFMFLFLLIVIKLSATGKYSKAADSKYYFLFNGDRVNPGEKYEIKTPDVLLTITSDSWDPNATVTWESTEQGVVAFDATSQYNANNIKKLDRVGPGYSTINAIVKEGTSSFTVSCNISVDLLIDYQSMHASTDTKTKQKFIMMNRNATQEVLLKYIDYVPKNETQTVSGAAIAVTAASYDSDNEGVVTVLSNGTITAVGAGSAIVTCTSKTMSSKDKIQSVSFRVIVKPTFGLDYQDIDGLHHDEDSVDDINISDIAEKVPSDFIISTNSTMASNLHWKIVDLGTGVELPQSGNELSYTMKLSSNLTFSNVKAGTYGVYAFADDDLDEYNSMPYAYKTIVVPVHINNPNIIMTVEDTFNILDNSNILSADMFTYNFESGSIDAASVNETKDIITAERSGKEIFRPVLSSKYDKNIYVLDKDYRIDVTVIDGIALSTSHATLFTKGTLLLKALLTDRSLEVTWSSDTPSVASVEGGLVTAVKAGTATITARVVKDGIVKKATCTITVLDSVTGITVSPKDIILPIKGYATLRATITPSNISGVTLYWKSSDDSIVGIDEPTNLSTTVIAKASGTAVISAINQDNVVVGYCNVTVQQPVSGITLSDTSVTVKLSERQLKLAAIVAPENATDKSIIWSSSDEAKAKVDTNGTVTLLQPGTVTIIATSNDNPKKFALCNITIQTPTASVSLDDKSKTMYVGQSVRLTYTILPTDASVNSVIWSSSDTSVASVDTSGKVTAKKAGTAVISVKTQDGGYVSSCNITVKSVASGIKLDVLSLQLKVGDVYYMKATLVPVDSTDSLTWGSSDLKVVTVDKSGKITAMSSGTANITVKSDGGGTAYCKVTVTQPVKGLILNYTQKTIYKKGKFQLMASVTPSGASNLSVSWTSSNSKVAEVSKTGLVKGLTGGTAIITCTTNDGGYNSSCIVTVKELITSIKLNHSSYLLGIGKSVILTAKASSDTVSSSKVRWTSRNKNVAAVNQNGKVTAVSYGNTTITATATDGSGAQESCTIQVIKPVTKVRMSKSVLFMLVGDNKDLNVTLTPKNATYRKVKWVSSDNNVAFVDEDGLVTALSAGSVTITALAKDGSGKKAICNLTISNRTPATAITAMDKKLVMVPGESKTVHTVLTPDTSTDSRTWSTDNSSVASVDKKTGRITARSTGTATITVMTASGKTATIEVSVIGLNMTELTLEQYTTYEYPLSVDGATSSVIFSIDNPQIAVLQRSGNTSVYISSRAVGTATITATVNGRRLHCKLRVIGI